MLLSQNLLRWWDHLYVWTVWKTSTWEFPSPFVCWFYLNEILFFIALWYLFYMHLFLLVILTDKLSIVFYSRMKVQYYSFLGSLIDCSSSNFIGFISVCWPISYSQGMCGSEWHEIRRTTVNCCSSYPGCCLISCMQSLPFSYFQLLFGQFPVVFLLIGELKQMMYLILGKYWEFTFLWYPWACETPSREAHTSPEA